VHAVDGASDVVSSGRRSGRATVRYRRSPHLVVHWHQDSLRIVNYATRHTTEADPLVCELLNLCGQWRTLAEIESALSIGVSRLISVLVDRLVSFSLLVRSDRPIDSRITAMDSLGPWNPEVGFFHNATKDVQFWPRQRARDYTRTRLDLGDRPAPVKRYPRARIVSLPRPELHGGLADVLLARRTSRRYSSEPVTVAQLSSILALSAGVQHWACTPDGDAPLKTSPSGGARHPIECYVVVRDVAGLRPSIYHYASDRHALERIGGAVPVGRMKAYVPESGYFAKASAMVFFTAVFTRQLWRYPYSRAYRAALVEAGHVCQTFLLTATSLGLAPYCLMGLADTLIEQDLGIDGITESVLYCAGVGRPPRGTTAAPLERGTLKTRPNRHLTTRS
jgi:SagB-type dehydrogenase family enzyme